MRAFRIWRIGEALRVYRPYLPEVWVVTLLHVEDTVPFGQLSDVTPGKIHQRLRKRIERSELSSTVIMGGFEVKADEADQQWIPHSHLLIAGCREAQLDSLCQQFTAKRASHRVPLTEPAKQISYTQKFLSLRQAQPRSGPDRPGGYRLRTPEHNEFLTWMAEYRPSELLFMFNLSRHNGLELQVSDAAARPARVAMRRLG
jgi:hypothetical protein